ncbi:MAG: membrane metalloprotease [Eudoraea sp.]|nr:membrane metalloprotease [Eudoraea sp.]
MSCSKENNEKIIVDEEGNSQTVDISANKKSVGDSANDLLSQSEFNSIVFELFYVTGYEPTSTTVNNFQNFLENTVNKPGGVQIELKEIASPGQEVYSIGDVRDLEDDLRTAYNEEGKIAVFGIFLDGEYSENTENGSVLGVAYRNTSFVLFEETVQSFSNQPLAPSTTVLESTVINHEFGHLLGLVNAGTAMVNDHQDVAHGRHCTSEDCLMYWTAETGEGLINMISGGSIPTLDSLCTSDLQANGGKL